MYKVILIMRVIALSIVGIIVFTSYSNADEQWEEYYDGSSSTCFYDQESLHYPYKDNQNIIEVWTKTIPNTYMTQNQKKIGYFSDLIYIDCKKGKYRRTEMLIYSESDELINRQMGRSTYYTIDSGSEADALYTRVCQ